MSPKEKESREAIISFLMKETGATRKETLEKFERARSFWID